MLFFDEKSRYLKKSTPIIWFSNAILQHLQSTNIQSVIASRADRLEQRHLDEHLYASQNLVERFSSSVALAAASSGSANCQNALAWDAAAI
jgi:hypothetical protein